jgi:hypothetical protein
MIKFIAPFLIFLLACSSNTGSANKSNPKISQILPGGKKLYVKDSTLYSYDFIKEIRSLSDVYDSLSLIGTQIVIDAKDTINLMTILHPNDHIIYSSFNNAGKYVLDLTVENYSSFKYTFKINDQVRNTGLATIDISPYIFGMETETDENGEIFVIERFYDMQNTSTFIGIDFENANKAVFEFYCESDTAMSISNIPTLIRQ